MEGRGKGAPPDIPPLEKEGKQGPPLSMREKLKKHRDHPSCSTCHNLIDPIGFGLENYDFLGRWRDKVDGKPVDARGTLPSGESFEGPAELKRVLLNRKAEFIRNLTRKMLGYALGRGLVDRDECAINQLTTELAANNYRARDLIRGIVLSVPFRFQQKVEEDRH